MRHDGQVELVFAFGPFLFDPQRRTLSRSGRPVALGSRARDILKALLERAGETVPKRELLSCVWPGTLVEEGTLRVHITTLRKVLGDGNDAGVRYVESVTGFGYRFVAPVTQGVSGTLTPVAEASAHTIPPLLTPIFGRGAVVSSLITSLPEKRLMTVVGAGGIGKTTVAVAAAEQLRGAYPDGVHYADLHAISDTGLVCRSVGSVLGLATAAADTYSSLVAYTRSRKLLLVLDNCEHLIETAAQLVEQLLMGAPHINILATSREPLRARGEWLLRLEPLELPTPGTKLTAREALTFPGIQLFAERAHASLHTFALSDEDVAAVTEICHRLDGLPLAIELAAARVDLFGVRGLAARLDDGLGLLTQGRRTAAARHQTLRATMDWSYELLSAGEQQTLRRLAVFAGAFTAGAARAVAADPTERAGQIAEVLASLAAKSLLTVERMADQTCYRLLNSSRAYALEKLESAAETGTIKRRHAQLCHAWGLEASGHDTDGTQASPESLRQKIEDIRAALDWCLGAQGDPRLGLELTACSAPLWFRLSFHGEYALRAERALAVLPSVAPGEGPLELQLNAALGEALVFTRGTGQEVRVAYHRTLELAGQLGAVQDHWRAVWGLYVDRLIAADYAGSVDLAQRFQQLPAVAGDLSRELTGERMLATSHYLAGNPTIARHHAQQMLARLGADPVPADRLLLDNEVAMNAIVPAILWVLGFADQARAAADRAVQQALAAAHALTLCYTVAFVCPVLLWTADRARARALMQMLAQQAASHSLGYWSCWATCLELGMGTPGEGVEGACCMELASNPLCTPLHLEVLATLRPELASTEILARAERGAAGWCTPELLRIQAERMAHRHPCGAQQAEAGLHRALAAARSQGAHAWELRAAVSLARLRRDRGRGQEACALLESVLGRFVEGFDTPDWLAARALLDELSHAGPEACAV